MHPEGTLAPDLKLTLADRNNIDIGQSTVTDVEATHQFASLTTLLAVHNPAITSP